MYAAFGHRRSLAPAGREPHSHEPHTRVPMRYLRHSAEKTRRYCCSIDRWCNTGVVVAHLTLPSGSTLLTADPLQPLKEPPLPSNSAFLENLRGQSRILQLRDNRQGIFSNSCQGTEAVRGECLLATAAPAEISNLVSSARLRTFRDTVRSSSHETSRRSCRANANGKVAARRRRCCYRGARSFDIR